MTRGISPFLGGLGAGAALISLLAVTVLKRAGAMGAWTQRETRQARARRHCQRAERLARLSPGYLDACRAAGL